jgi:hypothetical protein
MELQNYQQANGLQLAEKLGVKKFKDHYEAFNPQRTVSILKKQYPQEVKLYLYVQVAKLSEYIDAKKRLNGPEEYQLAVDALLDYGQSWSLEHFNLLFQKIIRGEYKIYERLKVAELLDFARQYESLVCDARERYIEQKNKPAVEVKEVKYTPPQDKISDKLRGTLSVHDHLERMGALGLIEQKEVNKLKKDLENK